MNILLIILLVILVVIVLVVVIAAASKNDYTIEREIVINEPVASVLSYLKFLKNADNFHKWQMDDPAIKKEFKGTDGTTGATVKWDSKKAGKGEQEIVGIKTLFTNN